MSTCTRCSIPLATDDRFCPSCGISATKAPAAAAAPTILLNRCPCGSSLSSEDRFCPACGEPTAGAAAPATSPIPPVHESLSKAPLIRRTIAAVLDNILCTAPAVALAISGRQPGEDFNRNILGLSLVVLPAVYFTLMEGLFGASIGKFFAGLRVYRISGESVGFGGAAVRNFVRAVFPFPGLGYALSLTEIILILAHPKGRRLGDLMGRTIVSRKKTAVAYDYAPPEDETAGAPPP